MQTINALGLKIDNLSLVDVRLRLAEFFASDRFHQIATVNPDFVMVARKKEDFQEIINAADLSLADGVGIHLPAFLQGKELIERIPGSDLTEYLLAYAQEHHHDVYLLARTDGLSSYEETRAALLHRFPKLIVHGCNVDIHSEQAQTTALENVRGSLVLANFGAPAQDTFLARLRSYPESGARIVMGVGGTFDFYTHKQTRAPKLVRQFGLEWLWRLLLHPRRMKRTWNYVVIFSLLCLGEGLMTLWKKYDPTGTWRSIFQLPRF